MGAKFHIRFLNVSHYIQWHLLNNFKVNEIWYDKIINLSNDSCSMLIKKHEKLIPKVLV